MKRLPLPPPYGKQCGKRSDALERQRSPVKRDPLTGVYGAALANRRASTSSGRPGVSARSHTFSSIA